MTIIDDLDIQRYWSIKTATLLLSAQGHHENCSQSLTVDIMWMTSSRVIAIHARCHMIAQACLSQSL